MLGAIAGDIIGSCYERQWYNIKTTEFPLFQDRSRFTDDTVLTVATADVLLHAGDYAQAYKEYCRRYPDAGYGEMFHCWAESDMSEPYESFGNGSAMRVSPVGFAMGSLEDVLAEARKSAEVTHNHPEGVKGAQATASAIFLARTGSTKEEIRRFIEQAFEYDLGESINEIRKHYEWDVTCQGSVPQAITAFLESEDFEDAIRLAISIGGDSDTIGCITGGIAQAFYGGVPEHIEREVLARLDDGLAGVVSEFGSRYVVVKRFGQP